MDIDRDTMIIEDEEAETLEEVLRFRSSCLDPRFKYLIKLTTEGAEYLVKHNSDQGWVKVQEEKVHGAEPFVEPSIVDKEPEQPEQPAQ